jgi:hypothetical protein
MKDAEPGDVFELTTTKSEAGNSSLTSARKISDSAWVSWQSRPTMIRLPPEITFEKRPLSGGGWCYDFHHRTLGALGRILLRDMPDNRRTHISCEVAEVADDPDGPITMQRRAIFEPLGMEIARKMEQVMDS